MDTIDEARGHIVSFSCSEKQGNNLYLLYNVTITSTLSLIELLDIFYKKIIPPPLLGNTIFPYEAGNLTLALRRRP